MRPIAILLLGLTFQMGVAQTFDSTLAAELQTLLDTSRLNMGLKGLEGTVILPNNSVWTGSSGFIVSGTPVDTNHVWHWESATMPFTATLTLLLHEANILDINDPIGLYIPSGTIANIDSATTIRQLMGHTTSFGRTWGTGPNTALWNAVWSDRDSVWDCDDVTGFIPPMTPNPGNNFTFRTLSNYLVLSRVIEAATGNSFETEMQTRIFTPFGLNRSLLASNGVNMSVMNGAWSGTSNQANFSHNSYFSSQCGAANLLSSSRNVAHLFHELYSGNILSAPLTSEMKSPVAGSIDSNITIGCLGSGSSYYGLGTGGAEFVWDGDTLHSYGHEGHGINISMSFHVEELNVTLVLVSNDMTEDSLHRELYTNMACHVIDYVTSQGPVSVIEYNKGPVLYPNPFSEGLTIDIQEPSRISISDLQGRIVFSENLEGPGDIYPTLSQGTYILTIETDTRTIRQKVIHRK